MQTSPVSRGSTAWRDGIVAVAALVVLATAGFAIGASSASTRNSVVFGCPGTMVIANTDCAMGVATAFDDFSPANAATDRAPWCGQRTDTTIYGCFDESEPTDRISIGEFDELPPWCEGRIDTTIYGCFEAAETPDSLYIGEFDLLPYWCHDPAPSLHPDGLIRALDQDCEREIWISDIRDRLAANKVRTDKCLALRNPGPVCIP